MTAAHGPQPRPEPAAELARALPRAVRKPLAGWGNHPVEECEVYRPERLGELAAIVARAPEPSLIGRGLGRAYGDASLNRDAGVVLGERLDRLLGFDPVTGVLECEAGVSLAEIIDVFVPRGFFFPVTPGTKYISIGGAVAADVHGKNHHSDGSISRWLESVRLLTAAGELVRCSRHEHPELFQATVGGMGLTGIVVDVRLRLKPIPSPYMAVRYEPARDLDGLLALMAETSGAYAYSVAWLDCLARGGSLGRSVLMLANHAEPDALPPALQRRPPPGRRRDVTLPFRLPDFTLNPFTIRVFNEGFYQLHRRSRGFDDYDGYFYPLDRVRHWNRAYGRRGVLQYQCLLPTAGARDGLVTMLEALSSARLPSFLAVIKQMGAAGPGLLSFPRPGYTLSLDLPYTGAPLRAVLDQLDDVVLRHGGSVYLAKDARVRAEALPAMYPRLEQFRAVRAKVDPERRFSSSLARRLQIDGPA